MAHGAGPLVYALLAPLAAYGVSGIGRMKSALWSACGEPDLADFDAAIECAVKCGWLVEDGAHVELTPQGLAAARHAPPPRDATYVPLSRTPSLPWPRNALRTR